MQTHTSILILACLAMFGCVSNPIYKPPTGPKSANALLVGERLQPPITDTKQQTLISLIDGGRLGSWVITKAGKGPYIVSPGSHSVDVIFRQQAYTATHKFVLPFEKGITYIAKGESTKNSATVTLWIARKNDGVIVTEKASIEKAYDPQPVVIPVVIY